MAVVKANAYGHGLVEVAQYLAENKVDQLGVAFVDEGIALRKAGLKLPILVLGSILPKTAPLLLQHNLEATLASQELLQAFEQGFISHKKPFAVHLKFDTGMHRVGILPKDAKAFVEQVLKSKACVIKAVYSHLACADDPNSKMNEQQIQTFDQIYTQCQSLGLTVDRHLANSGGILHYPESHYEMVRPGIMLYGAYPSNLAVQKLSLRPVMRLKSTVNFVKSVPAGATVSYGATWVAKKPCWLATVPIGYGDGWRRALSNQGQVLWKGQLCPIVGTVCMDQIVINTGQQQPKMLDEIVLIGQQHQARIKAEHVAEQLNSISYEVFTTLNERVPRVFYV